MSASMTASATWPGALPGFSVVMPVHDPQPEDLARAIRSVREQVWPQVEICLVDDASSDPEIRDRLDEIAKAPGVRFVRHPVARGIAGATNAALELATADFVVFLDHDDALEPDALSRIAEVLREAPDTDFVYSDHDVIDEHGSRLQTAFKPDWSPELLLSYMYIGHVKVARRSLAMSLGGFREGFPGAADYDFLLRLAERTERIAHVPHVLYHWRAAVDSMARRSDTKREAFESGRRAVAEALERRGIEGEAVWPGWAQRARLGIYRVRHAAAAPAPKISILIPTRDRVDLLRACIDSIEARTTYARYEIVVLDNESREPATRTYLESIPHRVVRIEGDFNFSRIVNRGVEACDGEYVVLLNNDTLVVSQDWLEELSGAGRLPGVGAVGAKLLYPDGRIQHAGVTLGVHGLTAHAFDGTPDRYAPLEYGYFAHVCRNVSAVTAACLLVSRDLYRELGGFDEEQLGVAWNDTDFCLRLAAAGHRVVMNPYAELIHLGSASRGDAKNDREVRVMFERWSDRIERDPYYNPNLSRLEPDFRLRTRLDEAHLFHYTPDGFREPGRGVPSADGPVEAASHDDRLQSVALEVARSQIHAVTALESELERARQADRVTAWLASRPAWRRLRRSHLAGRVWQLARWFRHSRPGEALLRRVGLIG